MLGRMATWPVGYFRAYTGWFLRHRRTVGARVSTINAEINRIGFIKIHYRPMEGSEGGRKTEDRVGISVTEGSTLEHLLQAYIANGGNPLGISSMMYPQSSTVEVDAEGEATITEEYPDSGVVFAMSADPNDPLPSDTDTGYGAYPGGMIHTHRYFPARQGGRISHGAFDHDALVKTMHQIRSWANQDLREMLSDLESRIIKQCDLREQLIQERDEVLVQAFGGVLDGVADIDNERFDTNLMVQNLIQDVSEMIYEKSDDGVTLIPKHRTEAFLLFTFPAVPADFTIEDSL
jgi:hypothetical protein